MTSPFNWLISAARYVGTTWQTRYDSRFLRPPDDAPPQKHLSTRTHPAWQQLQDWCHNGSGPGTSPWQRPGGPTRIDQRLSVTWLLGSNLELQTAMAQALCLQLDGSWQLHACRTRWNQLALRLKVKLADCAWWRPRRREDPWDSGYLILSRPDTALQPKFAPRRATLIVCSSHAIDRVQAMVADLNERQEHLKHAVRILILGDQTTVPTSDFSSLHATTHFLNLDLPNIPSSPTR